MLFCQESLAQDDILDGKMKTAWTFSGQADDPSSRITPSIKTSKHPKSLYLAAISTEMAIIHAEPDTLCNRVIDLPFKANGIIFQSVLLWHVYKQGFCWRGNFFAL